MGGCFFKVLAFENAKAVRRGKFDKGDNGVVAQNPLVVVKVGRFKIQLTARTPAHKQTGEVPALIHRLHEKTLASRKAVDEGIA